MDNNEFKTDSVQEATVAESSPSASTGRRIVTAVLVLVAALLLGYVIYDIVLNESPAEVEVNYESAGYQAPEVSTETEEITAEAALELTTSAEGSQEQEVVAE